MAWRHTYMQYSITQLNHPCGNKANNERDDIWCWVESRFFTSQMVFNWIVFKCFEWLCMKCVSVCELSFATAQLRHSHPASVRRIQCDGSDDWCLDFRVCEWNEHQQVLLDEHNDIIDTHILNAFRLKFT